MAYQKKIVYLDYLENGMKLQNAGFLRIEEKDGRMRLELRVKNIPEQFAGEYAVNADSGGTVGRISLSRGSGSCCVVWENAPKVPEEKELAQANGIYIRLPGRHLLQAQWDVPMELLVEKKEEPAAQDALQENAEPKPEKMQPADIELAVYPQWEVLQEPELSVNSAPSERSETSESGGPLESSGSPESGVLLESSERPANGGQRENSGSSGPEPQQSENRMQSETDEKAVCYGEKWEQLSHMYPIIHPFDDEREYLSIAPKDFVVLRHEYQKMVHNSFLLHGYYNYKHLILGKIREKEDCRYYLGVPGNFYTREKMVAEMFGFEAFEGEKTPAEAGEFGYFMKRVEI